MSDTVLSELLKHPPKPFVSVIIPVFNDAERLKTCLKALENQTYPKSFYEVIVVDNGSNEAEKIQGVVAQFGQAIATYESSIGSYAARNKGISLAKGEVVAFTDADCIPYPGWIETGVKHLLKTPNCGLVAGKIEIFFKNSHQLTYVETYENINTYLPQKELLEKWKFGATANIFTYKSVIQKVGSFDSTLKSCGDAEWGQRVYSCGYEQVYAEDACVAHPALYSFNQLYKRTRRLIGGEYDLKIMRNPSVIQRNIIYFKKLAKDLIPPLKFALRIFLNPKIKGVEQKIKILLVMFFIKYVSAYERIRLKLGGVSVRE